MFDEISILFYTCISLFHIHLYSPFVPPTSPTFPTDCNKRATSLLRNNSSKLYKIVYRFQTTLDLYLNLYFSFKQTEKTSYMYQLLNRLLFAFVRTSSTFRDARSKLYKIDTKISRTCTLIYTSTSTNTRKPATLINYSFD